MMKLVQHDNNDDMFVHSFELDIERSVENGLFHFFPIQGYRRDIPGDVPETLSKGVMRLKLSFQGDRASFPEGSYLLGQAFQWGHTWKIVFL